jgi:hypothetical protein
MGRVRNASEHFDVGHSILGAHGFLQILRQLGGEVQQ